MAIINSDMVTNKNVKNITFFILLFYHQNFDAVLITLVSTLHVTFFGHICHICRCTICDAYNFIRQNY